MAITAQQLSSRLALGFSSVGHAFSHMFAPIFYVVALSLESELALSHGDVIALILVGNILFGVFAPAAGWLGDIWRATGMMSVYFIGCGLAMLMTGLAGSPLMIAVGLALTGAFASIYHPVGIAWLVRNAVNRGTALGINGMFGGIGPGIAAISAGLLVDGIGWRAAFIVPGVAMIITAVLFQFLVSRGTIVETKTPARKDPPAKRRDLVRVFLILLVTMLCTGFIYQAMQAAMPKMFAQRIGDFLGEGVLGTGMLVAVIYFIAGGMQITAGYLTDRYSLKVVYLIAFVMQIPVLYLAGLMGGAGLFLVMVLAVTMNVGALPAENGLVARYAPAKWHGLAFGLKFIFAFGLAGLGTRLEGILYDMTGDFFWLFATLSVVASVAVVAIFLLPGERP